MDDDAYKIRFTPHNRSFAWSAINIELAAVAPQEEALFRRNKVAWKFFRPKRRSEGEAQPTMIFSSVPTLYRSYYSPCAMRLMTRRYRNTNL